jgi:hypothetical protein
MIQKLGKTKSNSWFFQSLTNFGEITQPLDPPGYATVCMIITIMSYFNYVTFLIKFKFQVFIKLDGLLLQLSYSNYEDFV